MFCVTTTRFNNNTFQENKRFRENNQLSCIYGTSLKIKENIPYKDKILVIEMNNQENKIMGIGLVENKIIDDKSYKIYSDKVYNRYIYKGNNYISIETMDSNEKETVAMLEALLFKGARHSKRAQGITVLPEWIQKHEKNFNLFINTLFKKYTNII